VPIISRISADDKKLAQTLREAKLIYMLGGFTHYLGQTLKDSLAYEAMLEAYQKGAVIAGSSAGAMVMCESYYDPSSKRVHQGLNLVPHSLVLPHHNTFGQSWASSLLKKLPNVKNGAWTVYGRGSVTLYHNEQVETHQTGKTFSL
jgi:cyanophycinase